MLLSALKARRRALAEAAGVPAYIIFTDRTLIEMAETRPADLDAMARITGVGAKKLDSYGLAFLEVINGRAEALHPQRLRLAGRPAGALFDRLAEEHLRLHRGADGTGKPLSLTTATLRQIAERRPATIEELSRLLGEQKAERFGPRFLAILHDD